MKERINVLYLRASTDFGGADKLIISSLEKLKKNKDFSIFLLGIVKKKDVKSFIVDKAQKIGINADYLFYRCKF
ncbi:hypothetical protein DRQ09_08615, partial [candidate division KSB1 bacterium]